MPKFRKKPVVIEAFQVPPEGVAVMTPIWLASAMVSHSPSVFAISGGGLTISTLEGDMRADVGDWVIKGVKGELYPCKPDIFAATYEPAD
jgi:hypothetical protein